MIDRFRPEEQTESELRELTVERWYAQAGDDAERLRHDEVDKAELTRIAEEMDDISGPSIG